VDNAETRRTKPSANKLWGNHAAVLEGDFLYTRSASLALEADNLSFLRNINEAATQMTEGQILELSHTHDWRTSREAYMKIITAKTAVLMSAACACAAIISEAEDGVAESLANFGLNLGIAFQLMDDLLDYASTEEVLGKPAGKDLKEGKITLPLIYTLPQIEAEEKKRLEPLFKDGRATERDHRNLIELVKSNGALDRIRDEAQFYVNEGVKHLKPFPDSTAKSSLLELSQYIIERKR
jgi:octaprenyl-diphosphate synthase